MSKFHSEYFGQHIYRGGALGWYAMVDIGSYFTTVRADTLQGIRMIIRETLGRRV